jgi:hypothetical protein
VTRSVIDLLAFPPEAATARRVDRPVGSLGVTVARLRRPFELVGRVARALPAALRGRPGR